MDNNLKKFHNARFLEKISVVVLGLILLTSMVPLQSVTAGIPIDFDEGGNLSNTPGFSRSPQIAPSPDGAYVLWQDGPDIFFSDISNGGASFSPGKDIGNDPIGVFGGPQLAVSGDNVYSVWANVNEIKFIPSFDKGVTHDPIDLETVSNSPTDLSVNPHVGASGSDVYVVWHDFPVPPGSIFFRASSDNGLNFNPIFTPGSSGSATAKPQVASFGSDVYVVWSGKSGTANGLSFVSNDNNGNSANWSSEQDLAPGGTTKNPQIKASGNDVYVTWWEDGDIKFAFSSDNGGSFVVEDIGDSEFESTNRMAMSSSGDVYVVWRDEKGGIGDIKFRIRDSSGTWNPPLTDPPNNLSSSPGDSAEPHIAASGADVYVVWSDKSNDSGGDILFKASDSNGGSFGPGCGEPIRDGAALSTDPHVSVLGNTVFVAWKDVDSGTLL